jgi:hypothetical protein
MKLNIAYNHSVGRDSSVDIVTELQAGRPGDRIPVGTRFSAHVQSGPRDHPGSYTMGTRSFQGVKRPGRGFDHPPHLASLLPVWAFVACSRVNLTFTFTLPSKRMDISTECYTCSGPADRIA